MAQKYYDDGIAEANAGNTKYSVAAFKIQSYLFNNDYTGAIQVSNQILTSNKPENSEVKTLEKRDKSVFSQDLRILTVHMWRYEQ